MDFTLASLMCRFVAPGVFSRYFVDTFLMRQQSTSTKKCNLTSVLLPSQANRIINAMVQYQEHPTFHSTSPTA